VDVRSTPLRRAARTGARDRLPFYDPIPFLDPRVTKVGERDGVPVRRQDGNGLSVRRHGAGERHGPGGRGKDVVAGVGSDVDATVLTTRIGVGAH
jgi:hypothetical protein